MIEHFVAGTAVYYFHRLRELICAAVEDQAPFQGEVEVDESYFFGMLKRERVNRRCYRTRAEARTDIFDYIGRFYNPRMRRRLLSRERVEVALNSTVRGIGT